MKPTKRKICSPSFPYLDILLKGIQSERFSPDGIERYSEVEAGRLSAAVRGLCSSVVQTHT